MQQARTERKFSVPLTRGAPWRPFAALLLLIALLIVASPYSALAATATTTTITGDTPDPLVFGQPVIFHYSVTGSGGTPTGNVTVTDGTSACTGTVTDGLCSITFTATGMHFVSATYAGDATFDASTTVGQEMHFVNAAGTTTAITSWAPSPSAVGQAVTVHYSVGVAAPGAGTPTGNVTVGDGVDSCTGAVADGQCSIALTTGGPRTLTATYAGDASFATSTSAGVTQNVTGGATTTAILADIPHSSIVGQPVLYQYSVTADGGTPVGNVTVTDGTNSCTGTVAAGQCLITFPTAGMHELSATYAGGGTFSPSTSLGYALHFASAADTTTTITSDAPDPSAVGQAVIVQYSVVVNVPGAGTPTGNIYVTDGVDSCSGTVDAGQCSIALRTAGARTLTATYGGDANFAGSDSAGETHDVFVGATTTRITGDTPNPSVAGQAVTFHYSVTSSDGTPTGNVTVSDGVRICTGTVAEGQCSITYPASGVWVLIASYAGDGTFAASSSASNPTNHLVSAAATTAAITSWAPSPSAVGQAVTFQYILSVDPPGAGSTTGNMTVSDGTSFCQAQVAAGQCSIAFPTTGPHTLTVKYAGDGNFAGSTSASVTQNVVDGATTTAITAVAPEPSVTGQPVTIHYSVTSGNGAPTGNVTVNSGASSCTGTVAAGQCSIMFTGTSSYSLVASYAGDGTFGASASAAVVHIVNQAATAATITSDTPDPSVVGQPVTIQYSVPVTAPGAGTPTGNVTVSDGISSCTGAVAAGQCSITFTTAGPRTLSATYAGDTNYSGSTSAGQPQAVNPAGTTTTIISDTPDPSIQGQAFTVSYGVAVVAPGAGTPTGNVTVSDGISSCTDTVAAGQCSLTLTTAGTRTLTATYAGDGNFAGSTSPGVPHTDSPQNSPPTAVVTNGQCSSTNTASGGITLTLADADGDPLTLTLASNNNPGLVPTANIVLGGSGYNRTLTVTAAAKKSGTAVLTFNLSDGKVTVPVVISVIVGSDKNETLNGGSGSDMLFGQGGKNTINGNAGNDLLCGGTSNDILRGGDGNDILDGANGNDVLDGGNGNDILRGNLGDDQLTGGAGADSFSGGPGTDIATDFTPAQGDTSDGTTP